MCRANICRFSFGITRTILVLAASTYFVYFTIVYVFLASCVILTNIFNFLRFATPLSPHIQFKKEYCELKSALRPSAQFQ